MTLGKRLRIAREETRKIKPPEISWRDDSIQGIVRTGNQSSGRDDGRRRRVILVFSTLI